MLRIAAVAVLGAMSALGASRALGSQGRQPWAHPTSQLAAQTTPMLRPASRFDRQDDATTVDPPASASGGDASITKAADGHYWAEADVNGRRVRFLVDTGATEVALTTTDATRLGINPAELTYAYSVSTASGEARAARVHLDSISVAGARVRDVEAMVIDHGLPVSLLGMTYLGRLSRFEATPQALILRP